MTRTGEPPQIPFGAWPSSISAADVARAGSPPSWPTLVDGQVWWSQVRAQEGGRTTVLRHDLAAPTATATASPAADPVEVLPAPWSASTRVHEYGGRSFLPVPTPAGTVLVFAERADQRLYRLDPGSDTPVPLTPDPAAVTRIGADTAAGPIEEAGLRYADPVGSPDGTAVWCVREAHTAAGVRRHLVEVPLDGSTADGGTAVRELVGGSDFLAFPRPSPDGRRLAWIAWDHPRMPWDGTILRVADIGADGTVGAAHDVLGGPTESVLQPEWVGADHPDSLYAVSDASGWWNLVRVDLAGAQPVGAPATVTPLHPLAEEFAGPLWQLGESWYALLADGTIACQPGTDQARLAVLDPVTSQLREVPTGLTVWGPVLVSDGTRLASVAGSAVHGQAVVVVDPATGSTTRPPRAGSADTDVDPALLPEPYALTAPSVAGRVVHANVYPPRNPAATGPAGTSPPFVVIAHGGPTSQSPMVRSLAIAFWTSRGIGVVDVNYGGSTGYGRAYRDLLREQWGVVDVEDVVAAVQALGRDGVADPARLVIRGGSAGGWTVLSALTRTDTFAAGASYYGVAELERFATDTHDFESRYLDGLIGSLPEHRSRYVERAPITNAAGLSCPVLLLQGADDRVVPPSQAEMFRDVLVARGIAHAYLLFEGEEHGFRRAETNIAALEAELSFYGQVLGFEPPGVPVLPLVRPTASTG